MYETERARTAASSWTRLQRRTSAESRRYREGTTGTTRRKERRFVL